MKRTLTIACFCLVLCVPVFAQKPTPSPAPPKAPVTTATPTAPVTPVLPTVDQILDKYVLALGGKAAINKHTTRTAKGTVEIPAANITGTIEAYEKAPNKSVTVMMLPGVGLIQSGYDGKAGWAQEPQAGIKDLQGAELAGMVREADFYKNINLKTHYPKMVVKGKEKIAERDAYVVEATPAIGNMDKLYFDAETGLLVRQDVERDTPQGKVSITNEFEDYKDVDGVKMPFTSRQLLPQFTMVFKITEVKHGETIDDAKFAKPVAKTEP